MDNKLVSYYCKLPQYLKDQLHHQAQNDRVPMVSIVQELLIMGLIIKSKTQFNFFDQFNKLSNSNNFKTGFIGDSKHE